jgi:hypothetical protein
MLRRKLRRRLRRRKGRFQNKDLGFRYISIKAVLRLNRIIYKSFWSTQKTESLKG